VVTLIHPPILNYCILPTTKFYKPSYTSPREEIIPIHPKCWEYGVILFVTRSISFFPFIWWSNVIIPWSKIVPYERIKPHYKACQNMISFWSRWRQMISYLCILVIETTSLVIIAQQYREHDLMPTSIRVYNLFMNSIYLTLPSLPWMWPLQSKS